MKLNKDFWKDKYENQTTGWDIGHISTPLMEYIDQIKDKTIKILIPGAGNSYEAEYLHNNGFTNVFVIDLVKKPLDNLKKRTTNFPQKHLLLGNFFELNQKFDLIIEQTFFCALNPNLRDQHAKNMHNLLNTNGKLVGLLFQFPLTEDGPPFGGSKEEYIKRFSPYFNFKVLENCYNSIDSRAGRELFIIFEKK